MTINPRTQTQNCCTKMKVYHFLRTWRPGGLTWWCGRLPVNREEHQVVVTETSQKGIWTHGQLYGNRSRYVFSTYYRLDFRFYHTVCFIWTTRIILSRHMMVSSAEFNSQTRSQNHKKCCNQFCLFLCICFCVKWWLLLRKERKCVNFDEWHQVGKQKSFICKKADPFYILDLKYNLKVETILSFLFW